MRIDCHLHVNWLGHDAAGAVAYLDALGMDQAWLHTWEMTDGLQIGYTHLSREQMWQACRRFPRRLLPFYAPDPRRPDAEKLLRADIKRGLKGFGECKVRLDVDDPRLIRLYRIAGAAGLPVLMHFDKRASRRDPHWYLHGMRKFGPLLDKLPQVNFVAHGPGFWRYISGDEPTAAEHYPKGKVRPGGIVTRLLDRHPNLYGDLSAESGLNALRRDRAWARRFLAHYSRRLLYGTDMYDRRLLDFLRGLRLPPAILKPILGDNARRLTPS